MVAAMKGRPFRALAQFLYTDPIRVVLEKLEIGNDF